ncbi:MAG: AMP-binding protein [Rhizobiales bacterium]|nr:AMP-binding protein [Hyphomicrobiales bacterium]
MLPELNDYSAMRRAFRWQIPARFNIGTAVCTRWAQCDPQRTAIVSKTRPGGTQHVSFDQLERLSNQFANTLAAHGVRRGDRVALLLPQSVETPAAHIAIYKLGAVAVPLATLFGPDALEYRLNNSDAVGLIMTTDSTGKLAGIRDRLTSLRFIFATDGAGPGILDLQHEAKKASDRFTAEDTAPDDPAMMIYTSGTTGPPKGALHGHKVLLGHIPGIQFGYEFLPKPDDFMWTPSDWAWAGGLLNVLLPSLYFGLPVLAYRFDKFDPEFAWTLLAETGVRNVFIPPTALKMMRAAAGNDFTKGLKLRSIVSGGEAVGRQLQEWSKDRLGVRVNEIYGQTECNLVLQSCAAIGIWRPGAIGKPTPGHEVAVIDKDGNAVAPGTAGTIAIRRPDPVMFIGYWKNEQATRDKFVGDWLLTGDQGIVDDDGYFSFFGRDDDVITSSGFRIGPTEIEDCLISHPAVKLAAVIGKPDELRTEIIKAFIVLNEGYSAGDQLAADISAYVKTRLSAHEYPREIAFEDTLPLTTTGKVIRRLLRERS